MISGESDNSILDIFWGSDLLIFVVASLRLITRLKLPARKERKIMAPWGKFASTNQKHYPYLSGDTSSVWNFCACSHFAGKLACAQTKLNSGTNQSLVIVCTQATGKPVVVTKISGLCQTSCYRCFKPVQVQHDSSTTIARFGFRRQVELNRVAWQSLVSHVCYRLATAVFSRKSFPVRHRTWAFS